VALGSDPVLVELPHRVGLLVDADAVWPEAGNRLQYDARHPNLIKGQSDAQSPDPAAGDENRQMVPG
jgi:hypothetical protein